VRKKILWGAEKTNLNFVSSLFFWQSLPHPNKILLAIYHSL